VDFRGGVEDLSKEYAKDVVSGDAKCANKYVEVSGVCGRFEKTADGRYFIIALVERFGAPGPKEGRYMRAISPRVLLYLKAANFADFAGLKADIWGIGPITVRGLCKGAVAPHDGQDRQHGFIIAVADCTLVKEKAEK
jgi:hypothetical protein